MFLQKVDRPSETSSESGQTMSEPEAGVIESATTRALQIPEIFDMIIDHLSLPCADIWKRTSRSAWNESAIAARGVNSRWRHAVEKAFNIHLFFVQTSGNPRSVPSPILLPACSSWLSSQPSRGSAGAIGVLTATPQAIICGCHHSKLPQFDLSGPGREYAMCSICTLGG